VYRYLAIAYPFRIKYDISRLHIALLLGIAWGVSAAVSLALLLETLTLNANTKTIENTNTTSLPIQLTNQNYTMFTNGTFMIGQEDQQNSNSAQQAAYMLGGEAFLIYGSFVTFFIPLLIMIFTG